MISSRIITIWCRIRSGSDRFARRMHTSCCRRHPFAVQEEIIWPRRNDSDEYAGVLAPNGSHLLYMRACTLRGRTPCNSARGERPRHHATDSRNAIDWNESSRLR